jgi:hypothetical protein
VQAADTPNHAHQLAAELLADASRLSERLVPPAYWRAWHRHGDRTRGRSDQRHLLGQMQAAIWSGGDRPHRVVAAA